ncbi:ATP-dependent DNA helicase, partial [Porphyromonas somerae]|uniref:ATP-dependent DNA helicase n=1 Tax=Porphyromonas somerae TaxID=322095 RepID=UPI002A7F5F07
MSNNRPEILDFFGFTPTSSQNEVIKELQNFFAQAPEHSIFLLRGYAGTGKSSLVGAFSHMLQSFLYPQMLLAPTGRAAKVLEGYCGLPAYTIHRTIYRQRISGDGVSYEVGYNQHQPGTIYIVDEASMINNANDGYGSFGSNRLLDDLVDFCFSIEGSKLLLIGDDAQLPPVGTEMSPALVPEYLVGFCSTLYQGILKDIVRQEEGGEIVYLSYLLRGR